MLCIKVDVLSRAQAKRVKSLNDNLALLLVVFSSDGAASMAVKGLRLTISVT